jgi:spoIIIJ-associated protein
MALKSKELEYTRVNVDIADYKKNRQDRVAERAVDWMVKVRDTGEPMHSKAHEPCR